MTIGAPLASWLVGFEDDASFVVFGTLLLLVAGVVWRLAERRRPAPVDQRSSIKVGLAILLVVVLVSAWLSSGS